MEQAVVADVSFRVVEQDPVNSGCAGLECTLSSFLFDPMVVQAVVVVAVAFFVAFAYVADARELCREELRRLTDEQDAFEEFTQRVSDLGSADTGYTGSTTGGGIARTVQFADRTGPPPDERVDRAREAYRETVMAVPHYEEDYGDTLTESLVEEFGPDVAAALLAGEEFSSTLQSTLVARSRTATRQRAELASAVEEEVDTLAEFDARLERIDCDRRNLSGHLDEVRRSAKLDAAYDVWARLEDLEGDCDTVAGDRQELLRDPPMNTVDGSSLYDYLYSGFEGTSHPVLSAVTTLVERIRTDRRDVARLITRLG